MIDFEDNERVSNAFATCKEFLKEVFVNYPAKVVKALIVDDEFYWIKIENLIRLFSFKIKIVFKFSSIQNYFELNYNNNFYHQDVKICFKN